MGIKELAPFPKAQVKCRYHARPDETIAVFPRTFIFNVTRTEMAEQVFEIEFQLALTWEDKEFVEEMQTEKWQEERKSRCGGWQEQMRETSWHPSVVLVNCVELVEHSDGKPEYWFSVQPELNLVTFNARLHGLFAERYELDYFPFDKQPLTVRLRSSYESSRVVFAPSVSEEAAPFWARLPTLKPSAQSYFPLGADHLNMVGITLEEWTLSPLVFTRGGVTNANFSRGKKKYPTLMVEVALARKWRYYLTYVFLFTFFITSLGFGVIFVPPEAFHDRCSVSLTLMLSAISFKYIVAEKLPSISYNTMVDQYINASFVVLVFIVLSNMASAAVMWHMASTAAYTALPDAVRTSGNWTWRAHWPGEAPEERMGAWLVDVSALGVSFVGWMAYQLIFIWRARAALTLNCRRSLAPEEYFSIRGLSSAAHADYVEKFQVDGLYGTAHTTPVTDASSSTLAPGSVKSRSQIAPAPSADVQPEVQTEVPAEVPAGASWPEGLLVTEDARSAVLVWRPRDEGGEADSTWEAIHEEWSFRALGPHADPYFAVNAPSRGPASRQSTGRSVITRQQRSGLGSGSLTPSSGSPSVGRPRRVWGLMSPNPGFVR